MFRPTRFVLALLVAVSLVGCSGSDDDDAGPAAADPAIDDPAGDGPTEDDAAGDDPTGDDPAAPNEPADIARRLYGAARRRGRWKDATIGAAARLEGCVLVTDDERFGQRAAELGVTVASCAEAFADLVP